MRRSLTIATAKASRVETGTAGGIDCHKTIYRRIGLQVGEAAHPVAASRTNPSQGGGCDHGSTITVGGASSKLRQSVGPSGRFLPKLAGPAGPAFSIFHGANPSLTSRVFEHSASIGAPDIARRFIP